MVKPKWLDTKETTRSRSKKQESKLAKVLNGRTTINSGATFGENDVITDFCEVEAKTTTKDSYRLTSTDWNKLNDKTEFGKMPIFIVDFELKNESLVVMKMDDFKLLIEKANG